MDYTFWIPVILAIGSLIWNLMQQRSIENLKSKNEKANLIHRIQFEKEFGIYEDLWAKLIELRNSTGQLRPILDYIDPNQTEEERKTERLKKVDKAFTACLLSFDKNKPFYSKEVYDEVEQTIRTVKKEVIEYQHGDVSDRNYRDQSEKNLDKIVSLIDNTCEIIRQRIGIIKVKD